MLGCSGVIPQSVGLELFQFLRLALPRSTAVALSRRSALWLFEPSRARLTWRSVILARHFPALVVLRRSVASALGNVVIHMHELTDISLLFFFVLVRLLRCSLVCPRTCWPMALFEPSRDDLWRCTDFAPSIFGARAHLAFCCSSARHLRLSARPLASASSAQHLRTGHLLIDSVAHFCFYDFLLAHKPACLIYRRECMLVSL